MNIYNSTFAYKERKRRKKNRLDTKLGTSIGLY